MAELNRCCKERKRYLKLHYSKISMFFCDKCGKGIIVKEAEEEDDDDMY